MTFPEFFTLFNLAEGIFWIVLAAAAYGYRSKLPHVRKNYWHQLSLALLLFGVSDWIEAYAPIGFLEPGGEWLFVVKILCVVWMIVAVVQYITKRVLLTIRKK